MVNMLADTPPGEPGNYSPLNHLGRLWLYGLELDWPEFYRQEKRNRVSLPAYPFEGQRYWIEGNPFKFEAAKPRGNFPFRKKAALSHWFYIPLSKQSGPLLTVPKERDSHNTDTWLVFEDESSLGASLVNRLEREGGVVITVGTGTEFTRTGERSYVINPGQAIDYERLLKNLQGLDRPLNKIVHLWGITGERTGAGEVDPGSVNRQQILGFYSLLYLARAMGNQNFTNETRLMVLTDNMQGVTGEEPLAPGKATVLGPCKVIPQEFSNTRCRSIDLVLPEPGTWQQEKMVEQLLAKFPTPWWHTGIIAAGSGFSNRHHWKTRQESVPPSTPGAFTW